MDIFSIEMITDTLQLNQQKRPAESAVPARYRSIFISDIHLGTRNSQAKALLDFLREHESDHLFLVGDIIDGWALRRRWLWPQEHSDVIQKILRRARKGTKVIYVLGNHDEFIRPFLPIAMGNNIEIVKEIVYEGLDGKRYLVVHGDTFDSITMSKKWLAVLGDKGYETLLRLNAPINFIRKKLGFRRHWSLSNYVKQNVKKAVMFVSDYEQILSDEAKMGGYDGIICGHIHKAEIRHIKEVHYLNCGDWVESCTAIVETLEGEWKIIGSPHRHNSY